MFEGIIKLCEDLCFYSKVNLIRKNFKGDYGCFVVKIIDRRSIKKEEICLYWKRCRIMT